MSFQIDVNNRTDQSANDEHSVYRVLIDGQILDELTGKAPPGFVVRLDQTSTVLQSLLAIKTLPGGLFCISGVVERVFPHLATTRTDIKLLVEAPGYEEVHLSVSVLQNSTFPLNVITVQMRHMPVRIQGRVSGVKASVQPLPGALVRFMDEPDPATPLTEHVAALRVPLHLDHAVTTSVRQRELQPVGTKKQLTSVAPIESQSLLVSDLNNLARGDVLLIGTEAVGEYVVVAGLAQDGSGQVLLSYQLNQNFAVGIGVQKYAVGAVGSKSELTRDAKAGEGVLFLKDLLQAETGSGVLFIPNELPVNTIEIADTNAAQVEYHTLGALTDDDGYYRFNGIKRVRTVYMGASATGFTMIGEPIAWTIDYGQPVNTVDFRLIP